MTASKLTISKRTQTTAKDAYLNGALQALMHGFETVTNNAFQNSPDAQ